MEWIKPQFWLFKNKIKCFSGKVGIYCRFVLSFTSLTSILFSSFSRFLGKAQPRNSKLTEKTLETMFKFPIRYFEGELKLGRILCRVIPLNNKLFLPSEISVGPFSESQQAPRFCFPLISFFNPWWKFPEIWQIQNPTSRRKEEEGISAADGRTGGRTDSSDL